MEARHRPTTNLDQYKISICKSCDNQKTVAKESRLCSRCAMQCIVNLFNFMATMGGNNATVRTVH